ncbi:MAG: MFS transporter [Caulobacteraceae bacterium]|nr:MFS transporter [Caulobacteraceae bacterium]
MSETPSAPVQPSVSTKQVAAAIIGNALEFYDFTVYTVFAVYIGQAFFPSKTPFIGLMLSLATFGVGFVPRPLGALLIGRLADRVGRRPAMLLSFLLMGVAIIGLACTPGYERIGIWAPVLAVVFRLAQGFALGGELGPAMAFLIETAPPAKRGLIGAWQSAGQSVASLVGGLVGIGLSAVLTTHMHDVYGWRIAFGLGALVLPFGLYIRRGLPETLHHPEPPKGEIGAHLGADHRLIVGLALGIILTFTTITYVRLFITTYAITTLKLSASVSYGASVVNGFVGIVFTLIGGALSDRFGRRPVMMIPLGIFLVVVLPIFFTMVRMHDAVSLWIGTGLIGALTSLSNGAALIFLTEGLRKEMRSAVLGTTYAIAVAVFGGSTQPLIAWLTETTHQPMSPAYYMLLTTAIGLAAMSMAPETAPHVAHRRMIAKTGSPSVA